MAHFHIKKKKGRPYLYVREIARVHGTPKVISQIYIGSPEKVAALAQGLDSQIAALKVEEFGALWLALQADSGIDLVSVVDSIVPACPKETGPSIGEYFLYCVLNRMVEPQSKNRLARWYQHTAIQQLRPVEIEQLTSQRYWEKWDRVSEQALEKIARKFFFRIWEAESPSTDCLLFDTTNYYTFIASDTKCDLAVRGNNKEGRHHLRQIGLGLMVARDSRLPIYYDVYPGNRHDSRLFESVMDEMFGVVCGFGGTKERLTVVFDKGMNSESNFAWIDAHPQVHFVTTYSPYFAEDLAQVSLERFEPVDTPKNQQLIEEGKDSEQLLAYRTKDKYWGKLRTVIVTYNPKTARKQQYTFDSKLETLRQELLTMRAKVRDNAPQWRDGDTVRERYIKLCERLHLPSDLFTLEFLESADGLTMKFAKDAYRVSRKRATFGKIIVITDNRDWSTSKILEAHLDRWRVEDQFRLSKDDEVVSVQPLRHWTESKIKCHLFTCVVAMTYLRRIELKLESAGVKRTAKTVMGELQKLHSILEIVDGRHKPRRRLEQPTKTQAEALKAFGHRVDTGGVLRLVQG